jgi:hypothetical protein
MNNVLFLLCPTDCLESTINKVYKSENYFYTSLGNSFNIDSETLLHVKELIMKHSIKEINFVLSSDNKIILDALEGQFFSEIKGMKKIYKEIEKQKRASEMLWKTENNSLSILSYYLNNRIKEFQFKLGKLSNQLIIKGKIYNEYNKSLTNIYPDLLCLEEHFLN